jgi:hypothetical protein
MLRRFVAVFCCTVACSTPPPSSEPSLVQSSAQTSRTRLLALRARENAVRDRAAPRDQPPWIDVSGSDPYRLVPGAGDGFVGVLRGSRAVVRLDAELRELQRIDLPETPTALCRTEADDVWIASRYDQRLLRVRFGRNAIVAQQVVNVAGVADIVCGDGGAVYVLPTDGSELITLDAAGHVKDRRPALAGGLRLLRRGPYLLETSLSERSVRVLSIDARGVPGRELGRIHHDGPLWAVDAAEREGELLIAVAGVEDRALVRAHGEFENIDSFLWLYRFKAGTFEPLAALDVADSGLVLPKAIHLAITGDGVSVTALAAGSGRMLRASWTHDLQAEPRLETRSAPPGVSDAVFDGHGGVVYASPLFDAWIGLGAAGGSRIVRPDPERRPEPELRLGEALFFTELMAPQNTSRGTHSRFSCETCHFEGGVDGRVHFTGRAGISVVTKPLFGLANNRPHFSRAMDPDLSSVCHNEFRVAGAGSGSDPWFSLDTARFSWLHDLGVDRAELGPLELRQALLKFFYAFSHAPNPRSQGRQHFSSLEAEGARAFRDHCQSCHAARLVSDDAATTSAFDTWESLIFSRNAPLVWARGDYEKTGILPYVHERGTRITSLRRSSLKPCYFTNCSAPDLAAVLERFREGSGTALHDSQAELGQLPPELRAALLAFLRLL